MAGSSKFTCYYHPTFQELVVCCLQQGVRTLECPEPLLHWVLSVCKSSAPVADRMRPASLNVNSFCSSLMCYWDLNFWTYSFFLVTLWTDLWNFVGLTFELVQILLRNNSIHFEAGPSLSRVIRVSPWDLAGWQGKQNFLICLSYPYQSCSRTCQLCLPLDCCSLSSLWLRSWYLRLAVWKTLIHTQTAHCHPQLFDELNYWLTALPFPYELTEERTHYSCPM